MESVFHNVFMSTLKEIGGRLGSIYSLNSHFKLEDVYLYFKLEMYRSEIFCQNMFVDVSQICPIIKKTIKVSISSPIKVSI